MRSMSNIRGYAFVFCLMVLAAGCGEDPTPPTDDTIEFGSGALETLDGGLVSYYFNVDLGGPARRTAVEGPQLYVNNGPHLTAESGLARSSSGEAPNPANYPEGFYPRVQQPSVGDQYYLYVDHDGERYFARIQITKVTAGGSNPLYARVEFNWDFNTQAGSRSF